MRTKGEGAQAAAQAIQSYQAQFAELESEADAAKNDGWAVKRDLDRSLQELAQGYLPDATAERLAQVGQSTGMTQLAARRAQLEQQRAQWHNRLQQIEADSDFAQRETLLDPTRGTLVVHTHQYQAHLQQLREQIARFDIQPFRWLSKWEVEKQVNQGAFSKFWRGVTFGGQREAKAKRQCCEQLGYQSYEQLAQHYQQLHAESAQTEHMLRQLEEHRTRVTQLVEEHQDKYHWVHHFEDRAARQLREELAQHLQQQDLRAVHLGAPATLKPLVAKVHALTKKYEYLGNMYQFIETEKQDRDKRIRSIDAVRMKWSMKPWDRLLGNKHKWLIAIPAMKQKSTQKRTRFLRRMRRNVYEYEEYDDYSDYLDYCDDFLPWDAFAYGCEEPMPYDGFCREVVQEVQPYRDSHGQEKADYSELKAANKHAQGEEQSMNDAREELHAEGDDMDGGAEAVAAMAALEAAESAGDVS